MWFFGIIILYYGDLPDISFAKKHVYSAHFYIGGSTTAHQGALRAVTIFGRRKEDKNNLKCFHFTFIPFQNIDTRHVTIEDLQIPIGYYYYIDNKNIITGLFVDVY